ncbi:hypothetical protein K2Q00_04045 [Patescibacteria group bacterium]|nr:hypothetical protein [Patescibacteria group bacterium]
MAKKKPSRKGLRAVRRRRTKSPDNYDGEMVSRTFRQNLSGGIARSKRIISEGPR